MPYDGKRYFNFKIVKKDPGNKHFDRFYEIQRFGQFDFLFDIRGPYSKEEYLEKTEKFRSYPRHMKLSLFHNDEKITKLRTKEFPLIYFVYDEVKDKGNKLYKKKKFREAIDYYIYAYSMLKWIEFVDPKKQKEFIATPTLEPILDSDIKECKAYMDDVEVQEDSYKASVVFVVMCLANAYMELRHYSEAVKCFDECLEIAQDRVPDLYFRRSQARACNRCSSDSDLALAKADIEKAISLKGSESIYHEHNEKLKKIIEDKKVSDVKRTEGTIELIKDLIKKAKATEIRLKERGVKFEDCFKADPEDQEIQLKVLKE